MKITRVELFHIAIPFAKPYRLSRAYGTLTDAQAVIFKVATDEGIVGLGEADPMNPFTEETPASVMVVTRDLIAPRLIGRDPTRISIIEAALDRVVHGNPTARGAVNMALYDIAGKVHGVPVHTLLGGQHHAALPLLSGVGSGTPEEDADAIQGLIEQGYRTVMIKMGALPIAHEIRRLIAAQERFGDRISIVVDANQGWEVLEAFEFIEGIRGHRPALIEQPVPRWDIDGLRRIRDRAPCALCADESLSTVQDAAALIRAQAVDAFSLKVSKNGGLARAKQIAEMAAAFGLRCLMNSMLEFGITQAASLQVGCTLTNLLDLGHAYGSVLRMADDVTDFRRNIVGGVASPPHGVGLGVDLDEDKLEKYTRETLRIDRPS